MIVVEREVGADASPEDAFDFLADPRNEARWNPNVVAIEPLTPGPPGLGSRFEGRYRRGGRMAFSLVRRERPSRLVFAGGSRLAALVAVVRVAADADGARVALRLELRLRGPLRLLEPLARPLLERQYADVVARLREALEAWLRERNAASYRRWFEEVVSGGDLAVADELLAPGYRLHFPGMPGPVDAEGHKALVTGFRTAFPDWTETVDDVIADRDRVVIRVTGSGTHRGEFQGVAATGARVSATGIGIARFAGGRIAEAWAAYDALGLLQQLEAQPVSASPRRRDSASRTAAYA